MICIFLRFMGVKSSGIKTSDNDKQIIVNRIYGTDEANETVSIHILSARMYCVIATH